MGKGDKKTKKGKIVQGSYGIKRPRKPIKAYVPGSIAPRSAAAAKSAVAEASEVVAKHVETKTKKKVASKTHKVVLPAEPELALKAETPAKDEIVAEPVKKKETPEIKPEA